VCPKKPVRAVVERCDKVDTFRSRIRSATRCSLYSTPFRLFAKLLLTRVRAEAK